MIDYAAYGRIDPSFIGPFLPNLAGFMAGMPTIEPEPAPELPEFAFTPHAGHYLSRTALCCCCDMPIHEKPGERNHHYLTNDAGYESGPYCPGCAPFAHRPTHNHAKAYMPIRVIGRPGPSLPVWAGEKFYPDNDGKADPIWDIKFDTKFEHNKTTTDAPLKQPEGFARIWQAHAEREEEVRWLDETSHLELASTYQELKANGIGVLNLDTGNDPTTSVTGTAYGVIIREGEHAGEFGGANYIANMARRIEWEQWFWANSAVHKMAFSKTKDGQLGIVYEGTLKDANDILELKRHMKKRWLETHDALPTIEEIENEVARFKFYGKPVLASMTDDELIEHRRSRIFGFEDTDPFREGYWEDDPPPNWADYDTDNKNKTIQNAERDEYKADREEWEARQTRVGYAGPNGFLGLDDETTVASPVFSR